MLLLQQIAAPSAEPTPYDIKNTERYARALHRLDVRLLDHMIVAQDGANSMYAHGDLSGLLPDGGRDALGERYLGPVPANRNRLREQPEDF